MIPTKLTAEKTKLHIGALLSIFNNLSDVSASNIDVDSVKQLEAILWVFRQLNDINYIEGYDLGMFTPINSNFMMHCLTVRLLVCGDK